MAPKKQGNLGPNAPKRGKKDRKKEKDWQQGCGAVLMLPPWHENFSSLQQHPKPGANKDYNDNRTTSLGRSSDMKRAVDSHPLAHRRFGPCKSRPQLHHRSLRRGTNSSAIDRVEQSVLDLRSARDSHRTNLPHKQHDGTIAADARDGRGIALVSNPRSASVAPVVKAATRRVPLPSACVMVGPFMGQVV